MKKMSLLAVLILVLMAIACRKSKSWSNPVIVHQGNCHEITNKNDHIKICYDSLITDSRCPYEMVCIWGGIGVAKFSFILNNELHTITLSTDDFDKYHNKETVKNYTIRLLDLAPYPGKTPTQSPSATVEIIPN
jgi:hypothetical protein